MPKIKLVVTDMDETLIKPTARKVSVENADAIRKAKEAGVAVTIATGRIYSIVKRWVDMLDIEAPVIACNGADIRKSHKSIYTDTINDEMVKDIIGTASEYTGVKRFLFSGDNIFCTPDDRDKELFNKWWPGKTDAMAGVVYGSFKDIYPIVEGNVQKVLLWAKNDSQHKELEDKLKKYSGKCDITCGERLNLEVNTKGMSKAVAVRRIAEMMGISMDEVMAIGDSGNDVEMLKAVGTAVAVENAMPAARAVADHITASCEDNGVARAIEKFVLSKLSS